MKRPAVCAMAGATPAISKSLPAKSQSTAMNGRNIATTSMDCWRMWPTSVYFCSPYAYAANM